MKTNQHFKTIPENGKLKINDKEANKKIIKNYLKKWGEIREKKRLNVEIPLKIVFKNYKTNDKLENILIKVSLLNDFYSTYILDTYSVAKTIYNLNEKFKKEGKKTIDERLKEKDLDLVEELCNEIKVKTNRREYSFVSKYCSFHEPDKFPIYDRDNQEVLYAYMKEYGKKDWKFTKTAIDNNYKEYVKIIDKYKDLYFPNKINEKDKIIETEITYKEIDKFNWTYCEVNCDGQ